MMRNKIIAFFIFLIFTLSFFARLYKLNSPVADWHSWRQADTASVARNFIKSGYTPFVPIFDDLSNVQSGKDNPLGYRMVEFPIYQSLGFFLFKFIPGLSIEKSLRLVSIFFSLISMGILYLLTKKYYGLLTGVFSILIFGFLPYSVYYSRTILPEMTGVGLSLTAIYLLDLTLDKTRHNNVLFLLSALFSAAAVLVKPTTGFLLIPILYIFWQKNGFFGLTSLKFYAYGLLAIFPFFLWRIWISQFPEGIPAYTWLLNGDNIRFTPAFFRWIIAERIAKLILGYTGIFLLFLGLITKTAKKTNFLFGSLLIGTSLYVIVFAKGNIQHDYYQILILPALSVYAARGLSYLFTQNENLNSKIAPFLGLISLVLMFALSWYEVRGYYWINHPEIVEAGQRVDLLTPKTAKIIAAYNGDTAFLYQTNRNGWPLVNKPILEMIKDGADFLVIANPDPDALNLSKSYKILEKKESYVIFDLRKLP